MIYLLDNNVLSEIWKPRPSPSVLEWFDQAEWFLPVPVIAEIQEGAEAAPGTKRKIEITANLDAWLDVHGALVLPWDADTARTWGRLKHSPEVKRQPQALWDSLIDAMGVRYNATVATRNKGDFRHALTFSPWDFVQPAGSEHPPA